MITSLVGMRCRSALAAVALFPALSACVLFTGTEESGVCAGPFAPAVLQEVEYLATSCSTNDHLAEDDAVALVDIYFAGAAEGDPTDRPTQAQMDLVRAHGGEIRHAFNVPATRTDISRTRLRDLINSRPATSAHVVADDGRTQVRVIVGIDGDLRDTDVEFFESLGGAVVQRNRDRDLITGWIDDGAIPCLRSGARVRYVEDDMGAVCLIGSEAVVRRIGASGRTTTDSWRSSAPPPAWTFPPSSSWNP